jgi:hypothetical protein
MPRHKEQPCAASGITRYTLTLSQFMLDYGVILVETSEVDVVYRFGLDPESAASLARQAAHAELNGFPHGVSVFSRTTRADASRAVVFDVRAYFQMHKTGTNPYHYTVELPRPVTELVAQQFSRLFGRIP